MRFPAAAYFVLMAGYLGVMGLMARRVRFFAALIATQFLITGYLRDIAQHVRQIQRTINDMDDVLDFRDAEFDVDDRPGATKLEVTRGRIVFDDTKPDGTMRKLLDVSRLASLGWSAGIDLESGLRDAYRWFVENPDVRRMGEG